MSPRIETAEVLSFRLKVPPGVLSRLPQELKDELALAVEQEEGEVVVSAQESDSYIRFRPIGSEAILTEVFLARDERGLFFQRVLGALMVRHGGDLHIRLTWNTPERNSHGDFAEVRITRGATTYPGLSSVLPALPSPMAAEARQGQGIATAEDEAELESLSPQEREIQELLARARAHWAEYQRLKAARKP